MIIDADPDRAVVVRRVAGPPLAYQSDAAGGGTQRVDDAAAAEEDARQVVHVRLSAAALEGDIPGARGSNGGIDEVDAIEIADGGCVLIRKQGNPAVFRE